MVINRWSRSEWRVSQCQDVLLMSAYMCIDIMKARQQLILFLLNHCLPISDSSLIFCLLLYSLTSTPPSLEHTLSFLQSSAVVSQRKHQMMRDDWLKWLTGRKRSRGEGIQKKEKDKRGIRAGETKVEEKQNSLLHCIHYIHAYIYTDMGDMS